MTAAKRVNRRTQAIWQKKELHIAVDFGNTFSGAAYAVVNPGVREATLEDIRIVGGYPDAEGEIVRDVFELPTEILLRDGETTLYGWEARTEHKDRPLRNPNSKFVTRFKLLLCQSPKGKDIRAKLQRDVLRDGRTAVDLIVDFLKPFRLHILEYIQTRENHDGTFNRWDQLWTFSVPADWTPLARRQMKEAVHRAGFEGKIKLISEPEAAALYVLESNEKLHKTLQLETAAVVGDLGGGTLDCATFLVVGLEDLSLKRLAGVKGSTVGSADLNDHFRSVVEERLKDDLDSIVRKTGWTRTVCLDRAADWFESRKKIFKGRQPKTRCLPMCGLEADAEKRFEPGIMLFTSDEIANIFDEVIKEVINLLKKQIFDSLDERSRQLKRSEFRINNIFLTGGLAANGYVQAQVADYFQDETMYGWPIQVTGADRPEQAVVRGAVWRSLKPEKISSRISDTSFGFPRDEAYDENWSYGGPGHEQNPVTGELEMKDRMQWVIKKGKELRNGQRFLYNLVRYIPIGAPLEFEECLFYSDTIRADYIHYIHEDIHKVGPLKFNLERWRKRFQIKQNGGLEFMIVQYRIVSTVSDDDWQYEIEVFNEVTEFKGSTNIIAAFQLSSGSS